MPSIEGMRKLLLPKTARQTSETPSPTSAGGVVLAAAPLLDHDDQKQRSHREINAGGIKGDDAAQQRTGHAARHPIHLVEQRSEEVVAVLVDTLWHIAAAHDGIRLVRQGENQVRFGRAGIFIALQHRNAVKQVPGVDHQGHQRRRDQRGTARKSKRKDLAVVVRCFFRFYILNYFPNTQGVCNCLQSLINS